MGDGEQKRDIALLGMKGSAALAAGLGLTLGGGAKGEVIYTDIVDADVLEGVSFLINLNSDFGSTGDLVDDFTLDLSRFQGYNENSAYFRAILSAGGAVFGNEIATTGVAYTIADARAMISNENIGPALTFEPGGRLQEVTASYNIVRYADYAIAEYGYYFRSGEWPNNGSDSAFLGVRFDIGGNSHFGWVEILVSSVLIDQPIHNNPQLGFTAQVLAYAYECQPGTAILAGATTGGGASCEIAPEPEPGRTPVPGSLAMLALGAVPLIAVRRRRRKETLS